MCLTGMQGLRFLGEHFALKGCKTKRDLYNEHTMLASLVITASTLVQPKMEFDLLLLAANKERVRDMTFMEKKESGSEIEQKIKKILVARKLDKKTISLIDGGATNLYGWYPTSGVKAFASSRTYFKHKKGVNIQHSETEFRVEPQSLDRWPTIRYLYPAPSLTMCMSDFLSLKQRIPFPKWFDTSHYLVMSSQAIGETADTLTREFSGAQVPCICPWGTPRTEHPNIIAFPPENVLSHYKLTATILPDETLSDWKFELVEHIRL